MAEELREVSYKCPDDGQTWSGIEGEVMTQCPVCGAEAEVVEPEGADEELAPTGETGPAETELEEADVEMGKYLITGLVDIFDEDMNIVGQFPIGSEQELPIFVGDKAVELGNATKVE